MSEYKNPWDQRFSADEYVYGRTPNAFVQAAHGRLHPQGHTLCIAEGEGRNAVFLAEQGMRVTTWDYAPSGLEKTRKLAEERGVTVQTREVDLAEAEWSVDSFDQIVCVFGHFLPPLRERTLEGVKQAIRPGGYYLTEVYSPRQLDYGTGGPRDLELLYAPEELLNAFSDWKIVHFFLGEVERHEGTGHNGLSHVIQLLAQKPTTESS